MSLVAGKDDVTKQICLQSHYASIVEAVKEVELYWHGDVDCPSCLRLMIEKHEAIARAFRDRLARASGGLS